MNTFSTKVFFHNVSPSGLTYLSCFKQARFKQICLSMLQSCHVMWFKFQGLSNDTRVDLITKRQRNEEFWSFFTILSSLMIKRWEILNCVENPHYRAHIKMNGQRELPSVTIIAGYSQLIEIYARYKDKNSKIGVIRWYSKTPKSE